MLAPIKRDLVPVALLASRHFVYLLYVLIETRAVLFVPIRYSEYVMTIDTAYLELGYYIVLGVKAPVVCGIGGHCKKV